MYSDDIKCQWQDLRVTTIEVHAHMLLWLSDNAKTPSSQLNADYIREMEGKRKRGAGAKI